MSTPLCVFEPSPGGGSRLVLLPPTSQAGMAIWAVVPAGILLLGLALTVSGRCFFGLLITSIGAASTAVMVRLYFRKDVWDLKPGAASRNRTMLGISSRLDVGAVEKVVCKVSRDSDERAIVEVGLQHPGGWTQVGEAFEHNERAVALANGLAQALGVGLELPPKA